MAGQEATFNVLPCVLYAVLGGLLTSASNNVISYAQYRCAAPGKCCNAILFSANIVLNLAGIACFLSAASYGPVAVVMPILTASKLLSNMTFQAAVGIARYSKEKRVGTEILCLAAMCLIEVGPTDPTTQPDALALLSKPLAQVWLLTMAIVLLRALAKYHCASHREEPNGESASHHEEPNSELQVLVLSAIVAISTALGASVGKMLSITDGAALVLCIACYLVCGVLSFLYAALAAFVCDMSVFMPMSECLQLLVNCATGLFIWGDGARIRGKVSYLMVYLLICIGVYLCSSFDVFADRAHGEANKSSHAAKAGTRSLGLLTIVDIASSKGLCPKPVNKTQQVKSKRQKKILHDAIEAAPTPAAVIPSLRIEIIRWATLGLISRDDLEALSSTLQSAADMTAEMLEKDQLPEMPTSKYPALMRRSTSTV